MAIKVRSYKMVILPFKGVPHRTIFRCDGDWWERITGTENQAEKFADLSDKTTVKTFSGSILVAMSKHKLERSIQSALVVEEFNLCVSQKILL